MKRIRLERAIKKQSNRISSSQIIPKCRDITQVLGKGGKTSDEWATANYVYLDDLLKINYQVYGMGDEELTIDAGGLEVFSTKERVNDSPENPNPLMVEVDEKNFEVLFYKPGKWERRVENLYHKTTNVPNKELVDVQRRYGICFSQ